MCLEAAQLLSTALNECGGLGFYKSTHKNHPCALWARKTKGNFNWLKRHGLALCEEYTKRYKRAHKCEGLIESAYDTVIPDGELTGFALAMPDFYKSDDPVKSYRSYYYNEKCNIATWKIAQPYWWRK
jgi:hypothetical protein